MQFERFWQGMRRAYARYDRLMEKQGFYIVLGVCVLVIVLSALYTFHFRDQWDAAREAEPENVAAGGSQEAQTLAQAQEVVKSAQTLVGAPTQTPFAFAQPVDGATIRWFDDEEPTFFAYGNVWQVHVGVDLAADYATPVLASASGTVLDVWQDNQYGLCVRIAHEGGYETVYAGLSEAGYLRQGDPVTQGQTVGNVGNGVLLESLDEPHLHFEVWRDGRPVDPMSAMLGLDN